MSAIFPSGTKGFEDARNVIFNIAKILKEKRPKAFMLENVKQLRGLIKVEL